MTLNTKKVFLVVVSFFFLDFGLSIGFAATTIFAQGSDYQVFEAQIQQILQTGQESFQDQLVPFQDLEVLVTTGDLKGQTINVKNSPAVIGLESVNFQKYQPGDRVRISRYQQQDQDLFLLLGQIKRTSLLKLTILFVILVLLVGRLWGALSLVGLIISFLIIVKMILPLILQGFNPVLAVVLGSVIIIPTTFYISHGFNQKTHAGVLASLLALVITGLLASYFVNATQLTGYASEEAGFLQVQRQGTVDVKGLLLAGIIIGALGILDDVAVGQASAVQQLKKANPKLKFLQLFIQAMKVGQDHISSMVNTLVLVYTGSALPLLLLFFNDQRQFLQVIELDPVAQEIVTMLVGSIGLVLAAPVATALAAWFYSRKSTSESTKHHC